MHLKIIVGAFIVVLACMVVDGGYIPTALKTLSKEDRRKFFTYQLYLGYFLKHASDMADVPEETSLKIYEYFSKKYQIATINDDLLDDFTCQWVEFDGECIDPDDPGIYPQL